MEYFLNSRGYPQADFRGKLMCFRDEDFDSFRIKTYNSRRGLLTNRGLFKEERAKYFFGDKEVILAFIRDQELVIILDEKS